MLRLNPRTLALIAVHRQTADSASTSPPNSLQHGFFRAFPTSTPSRPPSTLAHAPNLIAFLGHVPDFLKFGNVTGGLTRGPRDPGARCGVAGDAEGGLEPGIEGESEVLATSPKKRRLRNTKRTNGRLDFELIAQRLCKTRED
ncbi:hypothetical protein ACET3Z_032629 [Daucus carota]